MRAQSDSAVALVTEVSGYAETRIGTQTVQVVTLNEFPAGARVRLKKDARVSVLFYASGDGYLLSGPALIRFSDAGVEALSGNEPQRLPTPVGRNGKRLQLRPSAITQAGVVARGVARPLPVVAPTGPATLDARPTFAWREPAPGLTYKFTLRDSSDRIVAEAQTTTGRYELPGGMRLLAGERYRWSVSTKTPDGAEYAVTQRLRIADDGLREEVENFRPADGATAAQRVTYAVWLEQAGLADDARALLRQLAAEGVALPENRLPAQ